MLGLSGIDTKRFKAHSTRGASGSKAESLGFNIEDILKMGNWSNKSTWFNHYKKQIRKSHAQNYQNIILGSASNE